MTSWVRKITGPFKKASTLFNQPPNNNQRKPHQQGGRHEQGTMGLHGDVMACAYEDVQVMWSMLDKSNVRAITSS